MKILMIGDWHLGVKKDDVWVQKIQQDGIRQMLEYSKNNNIKTWIQFGDLFDVRAHTTQKCMEFTREIFDKIEEQGIDFHTLIGNHDCFYKNVLHPNTTQELLTHRSIKIYDKPTTVDFDGCQIDMIPWMCDENATDIHQHIKTSGAQYCIGHWELTGFYFYKGLKSHGLEPDFLKKYSQVLSGHFHTISEAANVKYIGTPWTLTAGDENDPRGFWEFNTETEEMKFIPNETTWHRKIFYPNETINYDDFKDLSVRVIVEKVDKDLTKFESELEKRVHELRVVNKVDNSVDTSDSDEELDIKRLTDMMAEYIDALPDANEKESKALKALANKLYLEVQP